MSEHGDADLRGRREDFRLTQGAGTYVADVTMPGMLHAVFVRSPHAHARLGAIDSEAAAAMPGVVAVVTGADLAADGMPDILMPADVPAPGGGKAQSTPRPPLVRDIVRHLGEPVAVVIADSRMAAIDAAEAVMVDYDPLPSVVGIADALASGAPAVWPQAPDNRAFHFRHGDDAATAAALAASHRVVQLDFAVTRAYAAPLETRGALAWIDEAGRPVLHAANQSPFQARDRLMQILGVGMHDVRVIATDVGGGFGMKTSLYREDAIVVWMARKLARPVRWISERAEAFLSDDHGRDIAIHASLGLDAEGRFTALQVGYHANIGSYLSGRSLSPIMNFGGIAGVYVIPKIFGEVVGVYTNTNTVGAYRGAGRPEATYVIERLIDVAAREIGEDPFTLRQRNLVPPEAMPYDTGFMFKYDSGDFAGTMTDAAVLARLADFPARREEARQRGRLRGIGICNPIEVSAGPFRAPGKDWAGIAVEADGTVTLNAGVMSVGQGLETVMSRIVAERLGIPESRVVYRQGDTDRLERGRGSGGSSAMAAGVPATWAAVDRMLENGRGLAAAHMEVDAGDVDYRQGVFRIAGTDRAVSLAEVASLAVAAGDPLAGNGEFQPLAPTYPNGCHICEVEIDPDTGLLEVLRYSAVEDIGRVINHQLADGQIHGGVAQAIGQAIKEAIVYDPGNGQIITGTFMDYGLTMAGDMPEMVLANREVLTAVNPAGVKGVGEAGTVGGLAATMNAVCDALAPLGIRHLDMPASPDRIWRAIQEAGQRA